MSESTKDFQTLLDTIATGVYWEGHQRGDS